MVSHGTRTHLRGVYLFERVEVLKDNFYRQLSLAEMYALQRPPQVRTSWPYSTNAAIVNVFHPIYLYRSVVYGVELEAQHGHGQLLGESI